MAEEAGTRATVVVNVFGGPGAGKTTAALEIAEKLKKKGYVVEYAPERAKELVWTAGSESVPAETRAEAARLLDGSFENQSEMYSEQDLRVRRLIGQCDFAVTDSPALLGCMYLKSDDPEQREAFEKRALDDFAAQDNFNFVVRRSGPYEPEGRLQTAEEAARIDETVEGFLVGNGIYHGAYDHGSIGLAIANMEKTLARVRSRETAGKEHGMDRMERKKMTQQEVDKAIENHADWLRMRRKKMTQREVDKAIESHAKWLRKEKRGERMNLQCCDLSGLDMRGANLTEAWLRGAVLEGADLSDASLDKADLFAAQLGSAKLAGASLAHADCQYADFEKADLSGAWLLNANLEGTDFRGADLAEAFMGFAAASANLEGANLADAIMTDGTRFEAAEKNRRTTEKMTQPVLDRAIAAHGYWSVDGTRGRGIRVDLSNRDLSGLDMRGANLQGALLKGANLEGTDLTGANLMSASLTAARFGSAKLAGARMEGAICHYANFENADLSGVDFKFSFLYGADFRGANLAEAKMGYSYDSDPATLEGANLAGATMWDGTVVEGTSKDQTAATARGDAPASPARTSDGLSVPVPKTVSGKDSVRRYSYTDAETGREVRMAEVTLPPHTEAAGKDVSFHRFSVRESQIKEFGNDPNYRHVVLPAANKDGEPWTVTLSRDFGGWEKGADGKPVEGSKWVPDVRTVKLEASELKEAADAVRESRREFARSAGTAGEKPPKPSKGPAAARANAEKSARRAPAAKQAKTDRTAR